MDHMTDSSVCPKKARKPYTLTKQRESWTNDEHERFIKALALYNRDWKKIESYVGTKTVVQIRSHAQKYFQKVLKSGSTQTIPPPRPKRRASDGPAAGASQASSALTEAKHQRTAGPEAGGRVGSGGAAAAAAAALRDAGDSDEGPPQSSRHDPSALRSSDAADASAQLEAARSAVSCQGLQRVYLFLASLFGGGQPAPNHAAMLQHLKPRDRQVVVRLLKVVHEEVGGLTSSQARLQGAGGLPAAVAAAAAAAADAAGGGSASGGAAAVPGAGLLGSPAVPAEAPPAAASAGAAQEGQAVAADAVVPAAPASALAQAGGEAREASVHQKASAVGNPEAAVPLTAGAAGDEQQQQQQEEQQQQQEQEQQQEQQQHQEQQHGEQNKQEEEEPPVPAQCGAPGSDSGAPPQRSRAAPAVPDAAGAQDGAAAEPREAEAALARLEEGVAATAPPPPPEV